MSLSRAFRIWLLDTGPSPIIGLGWVFGSWSSSMEDRLPQVWFFGKAFSLRFPETIIGLGWGVFFCFGPPRLGSVVAKVSESVVTVQRNHLRLAIYSSSPCPRRDPLCSCQLDYGSLGYQRNQRRVHRSQLCSILASLRVAQRVR